jgi:CheY-like chemotaxis protein
MTNILVIKDQAEVRSFLCVVLKRAGYQLSLAENGQAGIALLAASMPDLIITDIFMPLNDGLEVIRVARQLSREVPIIAISGGTPMISRDYLPVASNFGATATLVKPITPDELLSAVRNALQSASQGEPAAG